MKRWERGLLAGCDEACQLGLSGIGIGIGELVLISCWLLFPGGFLFPPCYHFVLAFLSCWLSFRAGFPFVLPFSCRPQAPCTEMYVCML